MEEKSFLPLAAAVVALSFSLFLLPLFLLPLSLFSLFLFLFLVFSSLPRTCRRRSHVHGGLHPGSDTPALRGGARPLPVVDVSRQDEVDRVFEKDGLERAREVGGLFKLRALGKVGVEGAEAAEIVSVLFFFSGI